MKDKVDKYLDKVVDLLVRGTIINYDRGEIIIPTLPSLPIHDLFLQFSLFSIHIKDMYGLTKEETDYVFDGYRKTILDKIENGK
jgi:hypothetical protein